MSTKPRYSVKFQEEGRGPWTTRNFSSLTDIQIYIRDRWQGVEYMDGPNAFHTDYCNYVVRGCTLYDLGGHAGDADDYWIWNWRDLFAAKVNGEL